MQTKYFDLGYVDIPWNFLVGDDGNVYEGRGFRFQGEESQNGSVISSFNDIGIHVAFIGTFINENDNPSFSQVMTFEAFLTDSVRRDFVVQNYTLLSQDQLLQTDPFAAGLLRALEDERKHFYASEFKLLILLLFIPKISVAIQCKP